MKIRLASLCALLLCSTAFAEGPAKTALSNINAELPITQVYIAPILLSREEGWQGDVARLPSTSDLNRMHQSLKSGVEQSLAVVDRPTADAVTLRATITSANDAGPRLTSSEENRVVVDFAIERNGMVIAEFSDAMLAERATIAPRTTHTSIAERGALANAAGGSNGIRASDARAMAAYTRAETIRPRYAFASDAFQTWGYNVGIALTR